jgi:PAS domain S-box-containing protein
MTAGEAPEPKNLDVENAGLYEMLFQNSLDALVLTCPDDSILEANPAACRIFGRTREEILVEEHNRLIDVTDPRFTDLITERKRNGKAQGELTARRKDGTLFPIEVSSMVFQNRQGDARTCMIIRDISGRKTAESERDRLINELRETLARMKQLSGLLPMCASCRKVRDQQGGWQDLESYIREHTEADFTHSICPDCRRRLYPETVGL